MRNRSAPIVVAVSLIFVAGCEIEHKINVAPQSGLKVEIWGGAENGANSVSRYEIAPNDWRFTQVVEWLSANRGGWSQYYATPALGKARVFGEGFMMVLSDGAVVLSDGSFSGSPRQLIQMFDEPQLEFIYAED